MRAMKQTVGNRRSVPDILDELTTAIPELRRRFDVKRLGLFGSYTRGQQGPGSDLDVLVEFKGPLAYASLVGLKEELNALLGMKVDVVPREGLKPYIGRRILAEVVWIDDATDGKRALSVIRERPVSPRPEREIRDFLHDILENINAVNGFLEDGDFDRVLSDRQFRYAFLYALFIIGEATTHIPPEARRQHPEIPWTQVVGLRNVVAHNYHGLSIETIWKIATDELEALSVAVAEILAEIERRETPG